MAAIPARPDDLVGGSSQPKAPDEVKVAPGEEFEQSAQIPAPSAAAAVQAEQRRIAQALHDTVSQTLTGTYLQALVIARKLEVISPEAAREVARLTETLHQAVIELHEVARQLQPVVNPPAG